MRADMVMQINEHLERWAADASVRAVLFSASHNRATSVDTVEDFWNSVSLIRVFLPFCSLLYTAGAGAKAFCAGGDVRLLATVPGYPETFLRHEYRMNHTISHYFANHGKPIVSLVSGIVMGGGVGVSMHGTVRL